nr:hypothetical protein BaRGS_024952 [Batillaria attramentaria]
MRFLRRLKRDGSQRLGRTFYERSGEDLAKALLGQKIVRVVDGVRVSAVIVETEAYLGAVDKAAHSFKGQTDRNKAMFMPPGTAYVYNIYGMYCCLNISSQGEGCAVLIRSVEPKEGLEKMMELRTGKSSSKKPLQPRDLGNGPSKLCQSLGISKAEVNQRDLTTDRCTWLEKGDEVGADVRVVSKRINIAYAEEWTDKPLRFYTLENKCVSVRDKEAEKTLQSQTTSRYFAG